MWLVVSKKYNLFKCKQGKQTIIVMPIKSIARVEKAIYDQRKLYIWYVDSRNKSARVDLETFDIAVTSEIIARIQFVSKSIKCKLFLFDNAVIL